TNNQKDLAKQEKDTHGSSGEAAGGETEPKCEERSCLGKVLGVIFSPEEYVSFTLNLFGAIAVTESVRSEMNTQYRKSNVL
ncbi:hypothetical protein J0J21_23330, partial [Vibrio vulnificus]|uniref:hypothetical protein n=1 Tax=Vibrio vulnificus TaxID=672 RepID=UPI0019D44B3B